MMLGLDTTERMSHSEEVKALEAALLYVEQQGDATVPDVKRVLFRRWRNLAGGKTSKAGKQTSITHFF
jgi:hypothetical protein